MSTSSAAKTQASSAVNRLVPFVHVVDVDASMAFYSLMGFVPQTVLKDPRGRVYWALMQSGSAEIMLAQASGPIDAEQQAVILYMYSTDVTELRQHLLHRGVRDGGVYLGVKSLNEGPSTVFAVAHPDYMPAGQLRIADPDGYVILIGQLA